MVHKAEFISKCIFRYLLGVVRLVMKAKFFYSLKVKYFFPLFSYHLNYFLNQIFISELLHCCFLAWNNYYWKYHCVFRPSFCLSICSFRILIVFEGASGLVMVIYFKCIPNSKYSVWFCTLCNVRSRELPFKSQPPYVTDSVSFWFQNGVQWVWLIPQKACIKVSRSANRKLCSWRINLGACWLHEKSTFDVYSIHFELTRWKTIIRVWHKHLHYAVTFLPLHLLLLLTNSSWEGLLPWSLSSSLAHVPQFRPPSWN